MIPAQDVARVRLDNAMLLFDEFVQATIKSPDAATLRGLERRFAERLQIQPSYWSQIKSRSRQIGERLARQFEQLCRKPVGWMDLAHGQTPAGAARQPAAGGGDAAGVGRAALPAQPSLPTSQPQDDDERFIVGLVLTYYRRHPQRARTRLLDLLGEVLTPVPAAADLPATTAAPTPAPPKAKPPLAPGVSRRPAAAAPPAAADDLALWARTRSAVAPLKGPR